MTFDHVFPDTSRWPGSHRAALTILIMVEAPDPALPSDPADLGLDYTASGLQRLLSILADLDVPATTAWTASALQMFPQLARGAVEAGHELALAATRSPGEQPAPVALNHVADFPIVGRVDGLPLANWRQEPDSATPGEGLRWRVNGLGGDIPVPATINDLEPCIVLPVSPYWIDQSWLHPDRPLPPSSLLEAWSLSLGDVRTESGQMTIVLHPHISGRPGFAGQITRFLDEVIASGDTWVATAADLANWWLRDAVAGSGN